MIKMKRKRVKKMKQEFDYKANIYFRTDLTVIAENQKEADRILSETMDGLYDEYKKFFEQSENIKVNDSRMVKDFYLKDKDREVER